MPRERRTADMHARREAARGVNPDAVAGAVFAVGVALIALGRALAP